MSFPEFFALGVVLVALVGIGFYILVAIGNAIDYSRGQEQWPSGGRTGGDPYKDFMWEPHDRRPPKREPFNPPPVDTRTDFEKIFGCKEEDYQPCNWDSWTDYKRRKREAAERQEREAEARAYETLKEAVREKQRREQAERQRQEQAQARKAKPKQEAPKADRRTVEQDLRAFFAEVDRNKWKKDRIIREGAKLFHPDKHGGDRAYTEAMQQVVAKAKGW